MNSDAPPGGMQVSAPLADPWSLYALMKRSRLFEEAVADLWRDGLVSGEMHLGTGEEAIIAGVVSQLRAGDAMALDHRGTAAMLMRGVDPARLLREILGRPGGLSDGHGGHMHLFSKELLAASSGIVGAAGPGAVGFALAAQHLRTGSIAVAFFGEGAMNQGMLLESLNLASVWNLPALFVCKDDGWAVTTRVGDSTGGSMEERVRGLGVRYVRVDGLDVGEVYRAARSAVERARGGYGSSFLHARCVHLEGHFLGFQLLRGARDPWRQLPGTLGPLLRSFFSRGGSSFRERLSGLQVVLSASKATTGDARMVRGNDPVERARATLQADPERLRQLDEAIELDVSGVVASALLEVAT